MKTPKKTTIIYITSDLENTVFDDKIRELLKEKSGGLPIVSVSRKPLKFGRNICIGEEAEVSESTTLRQILKGLLKAKTEYAILARADCLYPPAYFSFIPPTKNNLYKYRNVWVLGDKFWQKGFSNSAQMGGRKHWIKLIQEALKGHRGWKAFPVSPIMEVIGEYTWSSEEPVVEIRTHNNYNLFAQVFRNVLPKWALPVWGHASELKKALGLT